MKDQQKYDHAIVDLIIPAFNEQPNIPVLLKQLPWDELRYVIVADNASTDRTAELARAGGAVVVSEPKRGYGAACLAGLAWIARQHQPPDIVGFIDADLSDDPKWLVRLCDPIGAGRADLVIACRNRHAEPGSLTAGQRFGNLVACGLIRLLTGKRFRDLGPMRVVRYSSLCAMHMSDRTWGWTVEMQFKAATMRLRTLDIDVPYRDRLAGVSKISGSFTISARAGARILFTILRLWCR